MARKPTITLVQLAGDFRSVRASAEQMMEDLTEDQLTWSAHDKSWSVAQCFEHLRKFDRAYSGRIGKALDRATGSQTRAGAEYKPSIAGRLFLFGTQSRRLIRMPAPAFLRPRKVATGDGVQTIRLFLEQQSEILDLVARAREYDVNSIRFPSPLNRLIKLTVGDGLAIVARHEQRHVEQAQRQAALATGAAIQPRM